MQETSVCLANKIVGTLKRRSTGDLEFTYLDDYVRASGSIPLSLSLPLSYGPFPSKITTPYFHTVMGDIDSCFQPTPVAPTGCISFGEPIQIPTKVESKTAPLYSLLDLDAIPLATPMKQDPSDPIICLKDRQPIAHISLIEGEFYRPHHKLLTTHSIKSEILIDDGNPDTAQNLISNEIFMTLIAYNLGIPVPTIQRFLLDESNETYALIMDRPDRSAPQAPHHLPVFHPSETFSTALTAFGGEITFGKLRAVDINLAARQDITPFFELLRQHSLKPALDFRMFLRTILLCLVGGMDDFDMGNQLISLKPAGCRVLQMRDFSCTDIYPNTRKKFLRDIFGIPNIDLLSSAHFDDLARKIRIHGKYLRTFALEQALFIPKIAREILHDYPTLQNSTTIHITKLIEQRALLIHDRIDPQETRGQILSKIC